jgi:hypothetical protein
LNDLDELSDVQEPPFGDRGKLSIDKRVHFFPTAELLVTIPASRDELVLRRLSVIESAEKTGGDYLFVTSLPPRTAAAGQSYDYVLSVKSKRGGVRCTLDSGPEGMTVSPEGKVHWPVPADETPTHASVVISVSDASGQKLVHTFKVAVQ